MSQADDKDDKDDKAFCAELFSGLSSVEPSAELRRMVAKIPIRYPRHVTIWWPFGKLWQPALLLGAVAALGFSIGDGWLELREANAPTVAEADFEAQEDDAPLMQEEELGVLDDEEELLDVLALATASDADDDAWSYLDESMDPENDEEIY